MYGRRKRYGRPYKRIKRYRRYGRKYGARKLRRFKRVRYSPRGMGVPNSKLVTLRYNESCVFALNSVASATLHMRANGPFDPYAATGGHQPFGYDTWASLYSNVTVIGAKIRVRFDGGYDSAARPLYVGVHLNDDQIIPTNVVAMLEDPRSRYRVVNTYSGSGKGVATVVHKFSPKRMFGIANVRDNIGTLGSAVTTTPTSAAFFTLFCLLASGTGSSSTNVHAQVWIDYICLFTGRKDIDPS